MRLLDRYLLRQLFVPAMVGVLVFVVILMSETALKLGEALVGSRVPAGMIARYFLFSFPRALSWSMPVGMLVAVAMVTTAAARNGEIIGLRSGGISPQRMWRWFFITGAVASIASFAVEECVVPSANQRATQVFMDMTHLQPVMRPTDDQAFRDEQGRLFYIGHMDAKTNRMERVMVLEDDEEGRLRRLTAARWAELRGQRWLLREGVSRRFTASGEPVGDWEKFEAREVVLWTALQQYYLDQRTPFEMSTQEIRRAAAALEAGGLDAQPMLVRLHFKYSIPAACLVFALVAAPLAMRFAHLGSFVGIVLSILVVFLYNGVRSWGLAFGLVGDLPPVLAAWAQNVIFGVLGVWLVVKAR